MFLTHFDIHNDLLLKRSTDSNNLFVVETKRC